MKDSRRPRTWKRLLIRWTILGVVAYAAACGLLYVFQRRIQYLPEPRPAPLPTEPRYATLREVELRTSDGLKLYAWYWPGAKPVTLLIFHGNAGQREGRRHWMDGLHGRGWGVFLLDYRGYGGSEGSPTEAGFYIDAEAAIDWLEANTTGPIVYVGQSIGSGVAVELAIRRPPAALIVQGGFSSAVDAGAEHYWFLPVRALMHDRFENAAKIGRLSCPFLQIHGVEDNLISVEIGRRLFAAAPEPKRWVEFRGVGHNDLLAVGAPYYDAVDAFLNEHVAIASER